MKHMGKCLAIFLVASLVLLAGCAGGNTAWVFKSEGVEIPAGLYIIYQVNAISGAGEKILEADPAAFEGIPQPDEILKHNVEGMTASDWVNSTATQSAREFFAVEHKFNSLGMQLEESEQARIDDTVGAAKAQESAFYERNRISDDSLKAFFGSAIKKSKLFLALYGEGGELAVPEDELKNYFKENYVYLDLIPVQKPVEVEEGETRSLEELQTQAKADAEEYKSRMEKGDAVEDIFFDYMSGMATEEEKAALEKPKKGEVSLVVGESNRASFGDVFTDAAMSSKIGETVLAEDDEFYYVFCRRDILSDPTVLQQNETTVLTEMKFDEYQAKLTEWGAAVSVETNQAAIDRYKPKNISFKTAAA